MNDPVAIPANRLEIIDAVGSAVRPIFSVMILQRPARTTACATPIVPFDCDPTEPEVSTYLRGQPGHDCLDKCPDPVQNRDAFGHRWLVDIAWIPEYPGILCELNYLVDKRFQRLVQFNCLFTQLSQIVRLRKRQIMPQEEPLQCLLCCLLAMVQGILGYWRIGGQIYLCGLRVFSNHDSVSARRRASGCIEQFALSHNG